MSGNEYLTFIGTYSTRGSEGIYSCVFNAGTGELTRLAATGGVDNPSFVSIDPTRRYLYAVNETSSYQGKPGGSVSAFSINSESGALTPINRKATHGAAPCYVTVDAKAKFVLVANYTGGNVAVLPIEESGALGEACCVIQHKGSSVNPSRQKEPHAHSIVLSKDNRYTFSPDLGIDKIMIDRLNPETGELTPNDPPFAAVAPGAGPRHFTFHPNDRFAYVICELNSTITAFAYDEDSGALETLQTVSTLPDGFSGSSHCADIHVSANGKWLYGSNRGHDSIAIYQIGGDGRLTLSGIVSTHGKTPRNFNIDPSGGWVLAANQDSDSITIFSIDHENGLLTETGQISIPAPVCIQFMGEMGTSAVKDASASPQ